MTELPATPASPGTRLKDLAQALMDEQLTASDEPEVDPITTSEVQLALESTEPTSLHDLFHRIAERQGGP